MLSGMGEYEEILATVQNVGRLVNLRMHSDWKLPWRQWYLVICCSYITIILELILLSIVAVCSAGLIGFFRNSRLVAFALSCIVLSWGHYSLFQIEPDQDEVAWSSDERKVHSVFLQGVWTAFRHCWSPYDTEDQKALWRDSKSEVSQLKSTWCTWITDQVPSPLGCTKFPMQQSNIIVYVEKQVNNSNQIDISIKWTTWRLCIKYLKLRRMASTIFHCNQFNWDLNPPYKHQVYASCSFSFSQIHRSCTARL